MINYLWGVFLIIGIIYSIINGNRNITDILFASGSKGVDMVLNLVPLMCLWLGTMKIAETSGLLDIISKKLSSVIRIIFPIWRKLSLKFLLLKIINVEIIIIAIIPKKL